MLTVYNSIVTGSTSGGSGTVIVGLGVGLTTCGSGCGCSPSESKEGFCGQIKISLSFVARTTTKLSSEFARTFGLSGLDAYQEADHGVHNNLLSHLCLFKPAD
jgi:hypothetical protein